MNLVGNTTLAFSEEQAMLMDVAREFCRDKSPIAEVRDQLETETGYDAALWQELVGLGWAGIALPESVGGSQDVLTGGAKESLPGHAAPYARVHPIGSRYPSRRS